MLTINVPPREMFDEATCEFIYLKGQTLQLEHSLVSIAKWESKWHKPFLGKEPKTLEEERDYVRCMTITQNVDPLIYSGLTSDIFSQIKSYIDDPMTATWFSTDKSGPVNREIITSEIIYYWMFSFSIPKECEKWHLNRLLTQIRVANIKNSPPQKMSNKEIYSRNKALNDARRKAMNSKG